MKDFHKIYERIEDVTKILIKRDEKGVKEILWYLSYDPQNTLQDLGFHEVEYNQVAKKLQYKILNEYKLLHSDFNFANKIENNKYGIKTYIKDSIVRDIVLEHCEKVIEDPNLLRKCILNLCAKKDNIYYELCRNAGFKMLDFNEAEKEFLENTLDMYCIGEILKAIQRKKYPLKPKTHQRITQSKIYKENEEFALKLIENKEKILELYRVLENSSFEEIGNAFVGDLKGKSLDINELMNELKDFDIKKILDSRKKITKFFEIMEEL